MTLFLNYQAFLWLCESSEFEIGGARRWARFSLCEEQHTAEYGAILDYGIRASAQWRPGRSTTAHVVLNLRSLIPALAKDVRLFVVSLQCLLMCSQLCSIDILVDLQPVGWNLTGALRSPLREARRTRGSGYDHSIVCSWVPVSSPIDTHGLSLTVFE